MASPFPGMNPYLESTELWPSFYHLLADEIMAQLNVCLSDKYYAEVEVKTFLEEVGIVTNHPIFPGAGGMKVDLRTPLITAPTGPLAAPVQRVALPAGQIKARVVMVRLAGNNKIVTAIEILLPVNKHGQGVARYRHKREQLLHSNIHLVELDLLRGGQRPGWEVTEPALDTDYVCLVNRAGYEQPRISDIWPVALDEALPTLPIPLVSPDPDISLDLDEVFNEIFNGADYACRIDYTQPIPPPDLRPSMRAWLETLRFVSLGTNQI